LDGKVETVLVTLAAFLVSISLDSASKIALLGFVSPMEILHSQLG
jgi:hypothetical protein